MNLGTVALIAVLLGVAALFWHERRERSFTAAREPAKARAASHSDSGSRIDQFLPTSRASGAREPSRWIVLTLSCRSSQLWP